jgi:hypothetical protein
MKKYYYTIEEMVQIIAEYKASEGIECITDEEFTYLFGESSIYPNIYYANPGEGYDYAYVSDYEWHLLESGFNPFTGEFFDDTDTIDYHVIEGFDSIDIGEWHCSLAEDLEYYASLKTETLDVYVNNPSALLNCLDSVLDEKTYCMKIHWYDDDANFLIIITDEEQCYFFDVFLEFASNKGNCLKFLGSCEHSHQVPIIINYYFKTGKPFGHC